MNLLIRAAGIYTPTVFRRKKLLELFACTAAAFGCEMPPVRELHFDELLRCYALFTAAHAGRALGADQPANASDFRAAIHSRRHAERPSRAPFAAGGQVPGASISPGYDLPEIRRRLYDGAFRMGGDLRAAFRVSDASGALAAARVLYRALNIDLTTNATGEIVIRRCFFSGFYSGPVCHLIASLDQGLFAGLSGGCRLTFTQRITEGRPCCLAVLEPDLREEAHR
jgi:hypothetical protein